MIRGWEAIELVLFVHKKERNECKKQVNIAK